MPNPLVALLAGAIITGFTVLLFWPDRGLFWRWQHTRRLTERVLIEDALKYIHKRDVLKEYPCLQSIAGVLNITVDHAAVLLQRMQEHELVEIRADGGITILPSGREYALRVIRTHRLWERYLADETGFSELDWHTQAERLEHELTEEEVEALSAQLGYPTHDPHGDPIPTTDGEVVFHNGQPLTSMPIDTPFYIVHIEDEPEVVYAQLVAEGLHPGMEVRLTGVLPQRVRLWAGGDEHVLAPIVAINISVLPFPENGIAADDEACKRLSNLTPGQRAQVISLSPALRGVQRRRLMDLGILRGTEITAEFSKGPGKLTAYRVRGALVALREEQAELINVQCLEEKVPV